MTLPVVGIFVNLTVVMLYDSPLSMWSIDIVVFCTGMRSVSMSMLSISN